MSGKFDSLHITEQFRYLLRLRKLTPQFFWQGCNHAIRAHSDGLIRLP